MSAVLIPQLSDQWKQYQKKGSSVMRPYVKGEDLSNVRVGDQDDPETDMGMIAIDPNDPEHQWYVARDYFNKNFQPLSND